MSDRQCAARHCQKYAGVYARDRILRAALSRALVLAASTLETTCVGVVLHPRDYVPDIRDGLTHRERIVLQCLYNLQQERGGRRVPTGMLYGTVVEYVDMSVEEMQSILVRFVGDKLLP